MNTETERLEDGVLHDVDAEPVMVVLPEGYYFTTAGWVFHHIARREDRQLLCGYMRAPWAWIERRAREWDSACVCRVCMERLRTLRCDRA